MSALIRQIRWLFSPKEKIKFIFIAVLMAFSALLELAGIGILAAAATLFLSPESSAGCRMQEIMAYLLPQVSGKYYTAWAIIFIGTMLVIKNIFALIIVNIQAKFIFAKRDDLAHRIFSGYLYADYETFSHMSPDFCFSSLTRLTDMANTSLLPAMQILADIQVILLLAVISVVLFPAITLSCVGFMALSAFIMLLITCRANKKYGEKHLEYDIEENRIRQTGISGAKTIKTTASEKFFLDKFDAAFKQKSRFFCKLYTLGQVPRLTLESAAIVLASGVFAVMVLLDMPHQEIMLTFAVLAAVVSRILPALSRCHYNMALIRQSQPMVDSICDILKNLPEEPRPTGIAANASDTIELKNVSFTYKDGNTIFSNFNLTIEPDSSLAISGRSGRGKTTLIDLILGLLNPASGSICAGGIDIRNDLAAWRKQIGIVPQDIFIMEGSVAENIAFGSGNIDLEKVKTALEQSGLSDFSPDDQLTAKGNISGGQRQRIGIARALYQNAKILILDEATSALDSETENAFCEILQTLKGKKTLLVISHRESTLNACDRKIVL